MEVVHYPHPTLRRKSKPVRRVDAELKQIIRDMFGIMYETKGIGLAANQIAIPLQFFVVNTAGKPGEGEERVFINPVISAPKGRDTNEEGCLSIPGLYAQVTRPEQIHVSAFDLSGKQINETVNGILARVIQHEYDHLMGILFIDRVSETEKLSLADDLHPFELEFNARRVSRQIGSDQDFQTNWQNWESKYA